MVKTQTFYMQLMKSRKKAMSNTNHVSSIPQFPQIVPPTLLVCAKSVLLQCPLIKYGHHESHACSLDWNWHTFYVASWSVQCCTVHAHYSACQHNCLFSSLNTNINILSVMSFCITLHQCSQNETYSMCQLQFECREFQHKISSYFHHFSSDQ